jgi:protein-S-isoprenylcysteine O-methyltransferase Ste14
MYVGVLLMLVGHFLWFEFIWLIIYTVVAFAIIHLFVTLYEEPTLRKKFGTSYEEYLRRVPRWIPRFK